MLIKTGDRVVLIKDVNRAMEFTAPAGTTGTVEAIPGLVTVKMDQPVKGAEAWDNKLHYTDPEPGELESELRVVNSHERSSVIPLEPWGPL